MLDHLYHQSISNPLTPTIPSKPGPPLQTASIATVTPAKKIVRNDFSLIIQNIIKLTFFS